MSQPWVRYNDSTKVWEVSTDGSTFNPLVENPTHEWVKHNTGSDPGGTSRLWFDGTLFQIRPQLNASQILNTAAGSIVATDVQAALNELDTEKVPEAREFCILTRSTVQTLTTAVTAVILYDTEVSNLSGMHSTVSNTGRITIPKAGLYLFGYHASFAPAISGAGRRQLSIIKNGTTTRICTSEWQGIITQTIGSILGLDICAVNDYYESQAFQNSGGNLDITSTVIGPSPRFWAVRLGA